MTTETPAIKFTLAELRYLVARHKWLIAMTAIVGLLGSAAVYMTTPLVYRSQARLLVRYVTDTAMIDPAASFGRVMSPDQRGQNIINSEIEILTSHDLAFSVAGRVNVDRFTDERDVDMSVRALAHRILRKIGLTSGDLPPDDNARETPSAVARTILLNLGVEVPRNSSVIRLYYDGSNPALAQEVLEKLTEEYLAKHFRVHRSLQAHEFLTQQTDQLRARLQQTEDELHRIQGQLGIGSMSSAMESLSQRQNDLLTMMWQTEADLAASLARQEVLRLSLSGRGGDGQSDVVLPDSVAADRALSPHRLLSQLRAREVQLLTTYTENSPMVLALRQRIQEIEKLLADAQDPSGAGSLAVPSVTGTTAADFEQSFVSQTSMTHALKAKLNVVSNQLETVRGQVKALSEVEARIAALERRKALDETNYQYFSQTLERARIDEALDAGKISNISVVQAATYPGVPMRMKSVKVILAMLAFAMFGGLGLAVGIEYFVDHRLKRPIDVPPFLKLPLLISVPLVGARRAFFARSRGQIRLQPSEENDEISSRRKSWRLQNDLMPYWEALRDRVLHIVAPVPDATCFIGVTGCEHGNGATTVAAGLAFALSRNSDGRVLLIDANTDFASAHRLFSAEAAPCMMDLLSDGRGNTAVIQPNLFLLSAREVDNKLPVLSSSGKIEDLIRHVGTRQYNFVIYDMPQVAETSIALRMAGCMNGVILVTEAERTNRDTARHARDLLLQAQAKVMGVVLNKQRHVRKA